MASEAIEQLLARSHALGSDKRVTNYGGGNTSCKAVVDHPLTGDPVEVLHVKGSGGDLGTLTAEGLATLRLGDLRTLKKRYRGIEHEDEMVGLLDLCCLGAGAAPSIDTAMHGLLPPAHVDHLHPDAVIALAASADGEQLTKECFGDDVAWLPWRRPGFELALEIEALHAARPGLRGVVLGGHGLTTWGVTSAECQQTSLEVIAQAERFIAERGKPDPFGAVVAEPLPAEERRRFAAEYAPIARGFASSERWMVGHYDDSDVVLDFLSREAATRLVPLGTSCPDHFIRTRVRPLLLGGPVAAWPALHAEYRAEYAAYYDRHATADSPAMRGADPTVVLVPGVGMFSFGPTPAEARITGEFYVNAINVMRGAEALSRYEPVPEGEKFRVEYWALEEAKLQRRPKPKPLTGRVALVTGAASGIGKAIAERLADEGASVVVADRDTSTGAVAMDVTSEDSVRGAIASACLTYGGVDIVVNNAGLSVSKPLAETTEADWDVQHDVMARGSFLVSQAAARVMTAQDRGGDIVYVVSKNAVFAGPNNFAYSSAKASQAHQVRLLAAELGDAQIRVNGVNPDGVVQGSGIFAGGWGAERAKVYGVEEQDLGRFYASRTLLKREVLPSAVAAAVFALVGGDLSLTTGMLVPVDGGVPQAFLR